MHYIAIVPEPLPHVEAIRQDYDPLANQVPAHITLVFPAQWQNIDQVTQHAKHIAAGTMPFQIRLSGFSGQDDELIFLNIKRGNDQLIELHDNLYSGVLAEHVVPWMTFVPHMTIGRLGSLELLKQSLQALSTVNIDEKFIVRKLAVIEITECGDREISWLPLANTD